MKARIRKTGEIVDIITFSSSTSRSKYDTVSYIDSKGVEHEKEHLNYYWDFEDITNLDTAIDWEQRRYELTKRAIIGVLASPIVEGIDPNPSAPEIAHHSVAIADAVIKELKENNIIDKKKKEEAASNYAQHRIYDDNRDIHSLFEGFKDGINWFEENLWHPMSDKPEMGSEILILRNMEVYRKKHPAMGVNNTFVHEFDFHDDWESYAHDDEYQCWLYIKDLIKEDK